MPTIEELKSLYMKGEKESFNMDKHFKKASGWHVWSSMTEGSSAWYFNFKEDEKECVDKTNLRGNRAFAVRSQKK